MIDDRRLDVADGPPAQSARGASRAKLRTFSFAAWPVVAALVSAVAKVSIFNLPPEQRTAADWYAWNPLEALGAIASSVAILCVVFAPFFFLRPRTGGIGAWLVNALGSLLVVGDVLHVRYFSDIAPLTAASVAWQAPFIWESVLALVRPRDALLLLDVCIALSAYWFTRRKPRHEQATMRDRQRLGIAVLGVGFVGLVLPVSIILKDTDQVFRWDFFRFFSVRRVGLPTYRAYELAREIKRQLNVRQVGDSAQVARAEEFLDARSGEAAPADSLTGVATGMNVIMVMIESLHAWPVTMSVNGDSVMPNLAAFARRSINFERFYGQTWYGKTTDAEFITLNALHPLSDGSIQARYPTNTFHALPAILAARGYDPFSAHPFYAAMYRRAEMHPRWGFARSYFGEAYPTTDPIGMGMGDAEFFVSTVPRMTVAGRPFMAFLISLSSHYPFNLPARHRRLALGEFEGTMAGNYLHAVHYVDAALGALIEHLERAGLLQTSVVVVYGDHREPALTAGETARVLNRFTGTQLNETEFDLRRWSERQRLPLLIHLPGDRGAGPRHGSAGHIDIAPTILGLLGIDQRELVSLGRDLLREPSGLVAMRDASFVMGDSACVAPGSFTTRRMCGRISTGELLDSTLFNPVLGETRARLAMSDLILRGDLVPAMLERRKTTPR